MATHHTVQFILFSFGSLILTCPCSHSCPFFLWSHSCSSPSSCPWSQTCPCSSTTPGIKPWPPLVQPDPEVPAIIGTAIQLIHCILGITFVVEANKSKSSGPPGPTLSRHVDISLPS